MDKSSWEVYYFASYYLKYGSKIFSWVRFLTDVCQLRSLNKRQHRIIWLTFLNVIFSPQNSRKFAVQCNWEKTISKNERNFLFEKKMFFFSKNYRAFFSKSLNVAIFFVECVSNGNIPWNFFNVLWVFWLKMFKVEKIRETVFWKKSFHLLKMHLYQKGKAQNVLVVAGHLVWFQVE